MNSFDIAVLVIFGFCLVRGIFRGLVKEVSAIIGVLGGLYAAATYYPLLARTIRGWFRDPFYADIVAFLGIFCGLFLIVSILGIIIKYLLNVSFLGWLDRLGGAGFGAVKGLLIAAVLLLAMTAFLPRNAPLVRNSVLAPHLNRVSENLIRLASHDMKNLFAQKIATVKKTWQHRR